MSTLIRPYKDDIANNRPGVALFVWRVAVFSISLVASLVLFVPQLDHMSGIKKAVTWSWGLVLLCMVLYHVYLILLFKKLCYEVTADSVTIRSFVLHEEIRFSEIKEVVRPGNGMLVLKEKRVFSYFREAPQIVYPVAQLGTGILERFGAVTFYSFVDTFTEPGNLLLIRTRDERQYALSPPGVDEFVKLIGRAT